MSNIVQFIADVFKVGGGEGPPASGLSPSKDGNVE